MAEKKFNVKYGVLLPIVLLVTLFLWCVPVSFFGIDALTVVQQRVIALFVSLFIDMPWLYFVFEMTVLNSMLLYMIRTHERICKEMIDSL